MNKKKKTLLVYLLIGLVTVVTFAPIIWMFLVSIRDNNAVFSVPLQLIPDNPNLNAYRAIFNSPDILKLFVNSYVIAGCVTVLCILFAALSGYGLSRFQFKGKRFVILYILLTQMFPMVLLSIPYFLIISGMGLYNTYTALILAYTSFALPFSILMMRDFANSIPRELDEAATVDGCGPLRTFFQIIIPPSLPGLIATGVYTFILAWNEYLFATVLTQDVAARPLTLGIGTFIGEYTTQWNQLMALSILASVPLLLVFMFVQKYFLQGLTSGSVK
ncbi:carbohydrate ABC transporter permease [Cohnella cholangitidis]|uniref:Carbohydrate ABC transporter permease n=1 Tax=Cohnella cholangitidis TaxID=2598458 RepID=A0A7G5C0A1_9BACL|nr:carbohydrate ABC transporter permease [Cohnella cholangitidis]QMV42635.1 carbohydrate ABC transporter permease [Cohnella cholangitidis]